MLPDGGVLAAVVYNDDLIGEVRTLAVPPLLQVAAIVHRESEQGHHTNPTPLIISRYHEGGIQAMLPSHTVL